MKIAVVSEDGITISQHFGRAPLYVVFTVEDGKVAGKETRSKAHHGGGDHEHHEHSGEHHHDAHGHGSPATHASMISNISDCQIVLAGGMGGNAYQSLRAHHVEPVLTGMRDADEAVAAYLAGSLQNMLHRVH